MARRPSLIPTRVALPEAALADLRPRFLDRVLERVAPTVAVRRAQARATLVGFRVRSGQYQSAKTDRPNTRDWNPRAQSADEDGYGDQEPLRARARAAVRDMPLASSIALAIRTGAVGIGLDAFPKIDRAVLGLEDTVADAYEREIRRVFDEWAASPWSSYDATLTFKQQQVTALLGMSVSGDHFGVFRERASKVPGFTPLCVQHFEADLVSTPELQSPNLQYREGFEYTREGVLDRIHVANHYPGTPLISGLERKWAPVNVWRDDGMPNVLHVVGDRRAGQSRGVTDFAPVLEVLKAISDLVENELTAALVASLFTVFMASEQGPPPVDVDTGVALDADGQPIADDPAKSPRDVKSPPLKLGSGLVAYGLPGEKPEIIESKRPNPNFASFFAALAGIVSAGTGLPQELVMRRFTASYTASQGAMIEAWRLFHVKRAALVFSFCQPVRERVIADAVARGRLRLPGFFASPERRAAWLRAEWRGPTKGHLNPLQEAKAITERLDNGTSTLEEECAKLDGSSWEDKHPQRKKEVRARVADGLQAPVALPVAPAAPAVRRRDEEDPAPDAVSALEDDSDLETEEAP